MLNVALAGEKDVSAIKVIADHCRDELGFIPRKAYEEAAKRSWLLVVRKDDAVVGFVRFRFRLDRVVTIYEIAVEKLARGQGIGRRLIRGLIEYAKQEGQTRIQLKCPQDLPANCFYRKLGFNLVAEEKGKRRSLNIWALDL